MSCRQHRYPWPSLATSPNYSSPMAGLQGYIPYSHIAAVCMFELVVLLLLGHMRGSREYITYEQVLASPAVSFGALLIGQLSNYLKRFSLNQESAQRNVNICIGRTWTVINMISTLWKSNLSDKIKRKFFQASAISVLVYCCTIFNKANGEKAI